MGLRKKPYAQKLKRRNDPKCMGYGGTVTWADLLPTLHNDGIVQRKPKGVKTMIIAE